MRIEIGDDESGSVSAVVFLDGRQVDLCVLADEEAGYIEKLTRDDQGRLLYDHTVGEWVVLRRYGAVNVVLA